MKYCKNQCSDKDHVTPAVKPYWSVQGELTIVDGLLLKGARLVIPSSLQRQTLTKFTKVTKVSTNAENGQKYLFGDQDSVPKLKSWWKTAQHAASSDSSIQNH